MYYSTVSSVSFIFTTIKQIRLWAKTWPGLVIPQRNPLLYNNGGKARRDAS